METLTNLELENVDCEALWAFEEKNSDPRDECLKQAGAFRKINCDDDFRRGAELLFRLGKLENFLENRKASLAAPFARILRLIKEASEKSVSRIAAAKTAMKEKLSVYARTRMETLRSNPASEEKEDRSQDPLRNDFAYIKRKISFSVLVEQKVSREFLRVDEAKVRAWINANKTSLMEKLEENPMEGLGAVPGLMLKMETEVISR